MANNRYGSTTNRPPAYSGNNRRGGPNPALLGGSPGVDRTNLPAGDGSIFHKIHEYSVLLHRPYESEKYVDDKYGNVVPGFYKPGTPGAPPGRAPRAPGAPPSSNDPRVGQAGLDELRRLLRLGGRRSTVLASGQPRLAATALGSGGVKAYGS